MTLVRRQFYFILTRLKGKKYMTESIIIAIIGFLGAVIGSGLGILASAKLTNYRLEQLEKKVNLHNNLIERVYLLEKKEAVLEQHVEDLLEEE